MLDFSQLDLLQQTSVKFEATYKNALKNIICKISAIFTQFQGLNSLSPSDAYMRR